MSLLDSRDGARTVTTQSEARTLALARPTMEQRTNAPSLTTQRYLADVRSPIAPRSTMSGVADYVVPTNNQNTQTVTVPTTKPFGEQLATLFGGGVAGGFGGRASDNPITVVPGGVEGSSNSNTGLILLVVALGGGAAYWYYKKGGF